jgi:phospholipid/cholesterol/gamma-HCH transport system substrate-binding protein
MKISKEVKVGLFMISSIVLLYLGFNFLKGIDFFSSDKTYFAIYKNIDGLTESNQILLNGAPIGRVSEIIIQQSKDRVVVELSIDSEIIVTRSSIAILNGDLLGGRFLHLVVGKPDVQLEPKDTIQSSVAKGLVDVISENAAPVASNLQTTLAKMNGVLDSLSITANLVNRMLTNFQSTPRTLNNALTSVKGNLDQLSGTYKNVGDNLNKTLADLKPTLDNFKTLSDSLKMMELNHTVNKAQEAISNLNLTLAKLNKGDNTASKLLTDDSLYVNLNNLLRNIDSLANHFNENPDHFMAPLGKSKKQIQKELEKERKKKN